MARCCRKDRLHFRLCTTYHEPSTTVFVPFIAIAPWSNHVSDAFSRQVCPGEDKKRAYWERVAPDGPSRSPGRKSDHLQDQRQVLSCRPSQGADQPAVSEEGSRASHVPLPTAGQSVTPTTGSVSSAKLVLSSEYRNHIRLPFNATQA